MEEDGKKPMTQREKVHYLTNIKSFLTFIVVAHHTMGAFSGGGWYYGISAYRNVFVIIGSTFMTLNQSYFMCVFFFISAYFSPSSLRRKGRDEFLKQRLKRLGIPFLVFLFVVGPGLLAWRDEVAMNRGWSYFPEPGPPWFLAWLLIFNYCFLCVDRKNEDDDDDDETEGVTFRIRTLFVIAISFGFVQCLEMFFASQYIFMPITFGSLPFDILFFYCGLRAKKEEWLTKKLPDFMAQNRGTLRFVSLVCAAGVAAVFSIVYHYGGGHLLVLKNDCDATKMDHGDADLKSLLIVVGLGQLTALFCMSFSFVLIDFFQNHVNCANSFTKFLGDTSYGVYLIHPLVVVPVTWSFLKLLESWEDIKFTYADKDNTFSLTCVDTWYLPLGFVYTLSLSVIGTYLASFLLKKLPLFREVL